LTRLFSSGEKDKFLEQIITSVRHIIFWSIPITVLFIVLRAQIVRTILGAGNFDWNATRLTAAALALFVVSLVAQNLITLFVRAYYSQGKTLKPLLINVFSSILIVFSGFYFIKLFQSNILFSGFVESLFKVSGIPGTEVLMLPLGFSFGILINLIIYWVVFSREFKGFSLTVHKTWLHVFSSSIIMGFVTYLFLDIFDSIFNIKTLFGIFMQGLSSGIIGIVTAVATLFILKNQELGEVWSALHKKIWKVKVVVPDAELK
jgi:peptidoglycan biosynthesis protein MviN/MurJ (putative lipid II flippase)